MEKIKVMLVDDQALIREGLSMMLGLCDEIEIIGESINGKEALKFLKDKSPHVILMDIRMPIMDGVEATKLIKEKYPNIKIIILTTFNEDQYIFEGLKNGADGYILKDVKSDEIIKGIKTVYRGNVLLQPEVATKVVKAFNSKDKNESKEDLKVIKGEYEELTKRETEIAILVGKGKNNKEISQKLFITEGTVKNHLTKIMGKLNVANRTQLALYVNKKRH
ncbi:response regulator transcription factor [Dethiothermospora halolimnae]|uniref:response regulator transcription factor n=1 Tax=Dethiothermospora halolimnae TaxID=3114390 RepID=UPI003CCBBA06